MTILVKISKSTGVPMNIIWGFITTVVLGLASFVYMNFSLPAERKQQAVTDNAIMSLKSRDSVRAINELIAKEKMNTVIASQIDLKEDIKEVKGDIKDLSKLMIEYLKKNSIGVVSNCNK